MVRAVALLIGLGLLTLGGILAMHRPTMFAAAAPAAVGTLILVGTLFERYRYRRLGDAPPGPGWIDTGERFRDPETDATVAVFFHAPSGERRYVRMRA